MFADLIEHQIRARSIMRILKKLIQLPWMACYLAWGMGTAWVSNHKLPVAVFGLSFGVLGTVTAVAAIFDHHGFWRHVLDRNIQIHLFAGMGLYLLFARLVLAVERPTGKRLPWWLWYFLPVAFVMAISVCQEYVFSLMGETKGAHGDYHYWMAQGERIKASKSFADNATWFSGSMIAAWWSYFMPKRLWRARLDYLTAIGKIERSNTSARPEKG